VAHALVALSLLCEMDHQRWGLGAGAARLTGQIDTAQPARLSQNAYDAQALPAYAVALQDLATIALDVAASTVLHASRHGLYAGLSPVACRTRRIMLVGMPEPAEWGKPAMSTLRPAECVPPVLALDASEGAVSGANATPRPNAIGLTLKRDCGGAYMTIQSGGFRALLLERASERIATVRCVPCPGILAECAPRCSLAALPPLASPGARRTMLLMPYGMRCL